VARRTGAAVTADCSGVAHRLGGRAAPLRAAPPDGVNAQLFLDAAPPPLAHGLARY